MSWIELLLQPDLRCLYTTVHRTPGNFPKVIKDLQPMSKTCNPYQRLASCLLNQVNDSEEPMCLSLLKDNTFEANWFPSLQKSEHLLFEAVLMPRLEVQWGKELKWQWYLRICFVWGCLNSSVRWGTKWYGNDASGTEVHNSQLWRLRANSVCEEHI